MCAEEKNEETIFNAAVRFKGAAERDAYLSQTCGDNRELRNAVEELFKHHDVNSFLDVAPVNSAITLDNSATLESPGTVIGRYKLLEKIGEGGMAVVYMAEQEEPIRRKVALKIIKLGMDTKQVIARFEAERQALAIMDHPNIAKVFDAGATDTGRPYFVMELVKGVSITEYCDKSKLSTRERLDLFVQICNAVQHAHQKGIIHRDIKPSNVMARLHDGKPVPKVIDFGIAKATNQRLTEKTLLTRHAQIIGTPAYMSPEQAEMSGLDVDTRTDIYSLGVLLYELLTGTTPFNGERLRSAGYLELQRIIREEEPTRPSTKLSNISDRVSDIARDRNSQPESLAKSIRGDLDWIVMKSLEKNRTRRYETAHALGEDVQRHLRNEPILARRPSVVYSLQKFCRRNRYKLAVASVILVLVAGILVSVAVHLGNLKEEWARREALPMISKLVERGDYLAAFFLAGQAEKYIPEDPVLTELWPKISRPYTVRTDPDGTDVYFKEYSDLEGEWLHLGRSPLESVRFPRGVYRWKLAKDGYETRECTTGFEAISIKLQANSNHPEMVFVKSKKCGEYLVDKYEVTNEQFKVFVDEGGYAKQEYWKHPFVKAGEGLSWEEGMREFRDKAGRPGPSEWEGGRYPEGRDKYPVSGVSWYEAAAYAKFAGKSLPTVSHWSGAAMVRQAGIIVPYSNFGEDPAPVGSYRGIGYNGLYDIAGNVREWCFNAVDEAGSQRCILGGACTDPGYMFACGEVASPWDRSERNGFRCIRPIDAGPDSLFEPYDLRVARDISDVVPHTDEEFHSYKNFSSYDRTDIEARIESVDDESSNWRIETVSFEAVYGGERVILHIIVPKNSKGPYQPVVYFPPGGSRNAGAKVNLNGMHGFEFIPHSGRAFIWPIYKGTYDRAFEGGYPDAPVAPNANRDWCVQMYQDLARSIDYLESREDMDMEKLTSLGMSWGTMMAPRYLALENRIKYGILVAGGCWVWHDAAHPAVDSAKFLPHVKIPVLMLNGEYDVIFPYDTSQEPTFRLLGTPAEDKMHKTYQCGHPITGLVREELKRDVLEWLDKYPGPVDGK